MTAIPTWNKCVYTLMRVHARTHRLTHSTLLTVSLPFKSWTPVQLPVSSLQGQKFPARSPLSWKPASPFVSSPDCCPQPSLSDSGPHHSSLLSTHSSRLPLPGRSFLLPGRDKRDSCVFIQQHFTTAADICFKFQAGVLETPPFFSPLAL